MVWALDAAGAIGPHTMDGCCKFSLPSVGLSMTMDLGWFPWVSLLGLLPHVPLSHRKEEINLLR